MFQWFFNFFSEILFSLIFPGIALGIFAIVASKFIPSLLPMYKLPLLVGGVVLILFFTFQYGREWEYDKAKIKREADAALIKELSIKSAAVSEKIKIKYVDRIKYVKEIKEIPIVEYVTKEADAKCNIDTDTSTSITGLLNSAGEGKLPLIKGNLYDDAPK